MSSGQNIVCVSSIDWDFIWQGHQEIMSRFAAQGDRVLFVENTGVRRPRIRDLSRVRRRIRNWLRGTNGFREERHNLFVYSPMVLPFPYSRTARWINRTVLLRSLRRWMRAVDFYRPIVWTFLPTPLARDLIRELDPRLTVYYCIDDLASSSHAAKKITRTEEQVFRESDLVFVTSEKLRARAARFSEHVHFFPFGVSYEAFEQVRMAPDGVPSDINELPRPVIGYVGGLHQWLDQRLVCAVADAMPEASVALIGPVQTDVSSLRQRRNVHVMGTRQHEDVPRYIKGFDVGIVPYRLTDYTSHVYPTKLNEYLAMGIPVVATDLYEIRKFNEDHHGIVRAANDEGAFVSHVRCAMQETGEQALQQRVDVAQQNSWSARIAQMSGLIEEKLSMRDADAAPWDVVLARLYRTGRQRLLQVAGVILALYLLLFYTPALWLLAAPLRVTVPPQQADAIVVFGGGVGESGNRGGGYEERVRQAVDLYQAGFANRLILSSGFVYAFREAEIMRALATSEGIPSSNTVLETRAASTRENVMFVYDILQERGWNRILLVSSPYHMRRATLTWEKLAPEVVVIPTPSNRSRYYAHTFGASIEQVRGIGREYAALAYYWIQGWV